MVLWDHFWMPKGTNNVDIEPQSKARRVFFSFWQLEGVWILDGKVGSTVSYCSRIRYTIETCSRQGKTFVLDACIPREWSGCRQGFIPEASAWQKKWQLHVDLDKHQASCLRARQACEMLTLALSGLWNGSHQWLKMIFATSRATFYLTTYTYRTRHKVLVESLLWPMMSQSSY